MIGEGQTIVITHADLIKNKPPKTAKELLVASLSRSVLAKAKEGIRNSSTLAEFMAWQSVGAYGEPMGIEWMVDVCPEINPPRDSIRKNES